MNSSNPFDESNLIQCDGNITLNSTLVDDVDYHQPIETVIGNRPDIPSYRFKPFRNLVTIKRSNKVVEASRLPVVLNLNPRSLYNKAAEFSTLVEQLDTGVCCISESWDRSHIPGGILISDIVKIEGYRWVQNVVQRNKKGGKPSILVNEKMFHIKELCPEVITVPIGVEAVWALLTPKNLPPNSRVKQIAVASIYYSSKQTRKNDFLDHISQSYNILRAKYGDKLGFIIAGDFNQLNMQPLLNLSPELKQVVTSVTRLNPDAILDKILTNLHSFYLVPTTLPPLDNDIDVPGKPSDHLIVVFKPLSHEHPAQQKRYKSIKYRPYPDSGIREMGLWVQRQDWKEIYYQADVNMKAEIFEKMIMEKVDFFFPEKTIKVNENDQPWASPELKIIDRQRKREYNKNKKSEKWKMLDAKFTEKSSLEKESYYENIVHDLKTSNPGKWYSKVKRMSSLDPTKEEKVLVEQLMGLPSSVQAELIADQFAAISNEYDPLKADEIDIPDSITSKPCPLFEPYQVYQKIVKMKKKSSTVQGDIPWRIILEYAVEFSSPLSNIFNSATLDGVWPDIWKVEYVTPAPKVFPPNSMDDLRKISGTKNLSKILEALLSDYMIEDMKPSMDPSQFGNTKGLSIQHYLVKMVDKILTILDSNREDEKSAVLAMMVDWSKAFDRQDPKLGIQSFMKNGVRPSMIPVLISFFQNRKMIVKWHGAVSTQRDLPGGGPQGSTFGLLEYKSNSNDNAEHIPEDMRFKFVDDLSALEKLNLIVLGLSSYNFRNHVASDIGINDKFLPPQNIKSQENLDQIAEWTTRNKMKLNKKKTEVMIFNFTNDYQFKTRLYIEDSLLEIVSQTKLLGTIISSDLKWHSNTDMLVKKGYQRMIILHKLYSFCMPDSELVNIYILYLRSILEQSCQLWHYAITEEESSELERVQKVATKVILDSRYTDYHSALEILNLETLRERRKKLCLKFSKKCLKFSQTREMFPLNVDHEVETREAEKYKVKFARTSRLFDSAIPQMQRALNVDARSK